MAQQGWYPDPGGQVGMFRYWDGSQWSEALSPTPLPGPPSQGSTGYASSSGYDPTKPLTAGKYSPSQPVSPYSPYQTYTETKKKKPIGIWVILGVGVLVIALVVYLVVSNLGNGPVFDPPTTSNPGGDPTTVVCPSQPFLTERQEHPNDGRVYGGALSYPMLGSPWSVVSSTDNRVPFGRDIAEQTVMIHTNTTGKGDWSGWVASVLVGELYAGDGFYDPQKGSQIVNKCIIGAFYGKENLITPEVLRSEVYNVDGYDGWITETNLSFNIPGLETTSELAIVIIVRTSEMSSSIFYASIPNDAMDLMPDVNRAIDGLRVTT